MLSGCADISVSPYDAPPKDGDLLLVMRGGDVLLANVADEPRVPTFGELRDALPPDVRVMALARCGDLTVYAPYPFDGAAIGERDGLCYRDARACLTMPEPLGSLLPACLHLLRWYKSNRFCGRCGAPLCPSATERALCCESCKNVVYPMIAPAVIVAITRRGKLLLALNKHYVHNVFTLIAGYVEVGETLEHAMRREALEEVGLKLGKAEYIGNQPWGLSGSMMFAFHAEADGDEPICLEQDELSEGGWFGRDELPPTPQNGSVAHELIEMFKKGLL